MKKDRKKATRSNKLILLFVFFLAQGCFLRKPERLFDSAIRLWTETRYIESIRAFETLLDLYPDHPLAPKANFWIGDIYYIYLDDPIQAVFEYRRLVKNYAKSEYAPKAQWKIAGIMSESPTEKNHCRKEYQTFIKLFPNHPLTPNAQYHLAEAYADMGYYEQSITEFELFLGKYPASDLRPQALQRLGELYHIVKLFPRAIHFFNKAHELSTEEDTRLIIKKSLADCYVSQGEISKGLDIYEEILTADPDNKIVKHRAESLKERLKIMDTKQKYKW